VLGVVKAFTSFLIRERDQLLKDGLEQQNLTETMIEHPFSYANADEFCGTHKKDRECLTQNNRESEKTCISPAVGKALEVWSQWRRSRKQRHVDCVRDSPSVNMYRSKTDCGY